MNRRFAPRRPRKRWLSFLGLVAAAFGACAPNPANFPAVRDLAAEISFAEARAAKGDASPQLRQAPRPPQPPDSARVNRFGNGIMIAPESTVDFYLALDGPSILSLGGVGNRQGAPAVEVQVQTEGEPLRRLARLNPGEGARSFTLPGGDRSLVRLTFTTASGTAPTLLVRPEVRSRTTQASIANPNRSPTSRAADVVVYLIDTLRADHVGLYSQSHHEQPTAPSLTPRIDAFGATAHVFDDAVAVSSWTRPTTASIMTGLSPLDHGATRLDARLAPSVTTLAERLRDAGWRTAAWSANAHVTTATGFGQGFEAFHFDGGLPRGGALAASALEWLDRSAPQTPAFVFLHTIDPHAPYDPPEEFRRRYAPDAAPNAGSREALIAAYRDLDHRKTPVPRALTQLYSAEVAAADFYFGQLLDELAKRGRLDGALVVLLADHGEEMGDHGALGHGKTLFGEVTDIPLVIKLPHQKTGRRIDFRAQQIDLVPTLLAALGLPAAQELEGIDLFNSPPQRERTAFSHLDYEGRIGVSVSLGGMKWIEPWSRKFARQSRLFDRASDPGEKLDRAHLEPVRAGYFRALAREYALTPRQVRRPLRAAPSAEEIRSLQALGYL